MKSRPESPIWRPYTQEGLAPRAMALDRAEGAYLLTKSGQKIFDGISSWWLITHGHCHPAIADAIAKQASRLDQVTFANFHHDAALELANQLIEITPKPLSRVFFTDNGSTAVESALKMALQACHQSGALQRNKFLAFEHAYHGDTVGAMSVSAESSFTRPYKSMNFEVLRARHPSSSKAKIDDYVSDYAALLERHHDSLAGVIIEPLIQGAGGMIIWPEEAVRRIVHLARELGVYVIFDEVMTGFGRTGALFAMDRLGVTPDLVCLSKGLTGGSLPLAVTLATEEIYQAFYSNDKSRMFFHGHSFTGNAISCAAAVANIKLFREPAMLHRLKQIEEAQKEALDSVKSTLPHTDARAYGTIAAIDLSVSETAYTSQFGDRFREKALERGLFLRPLGNTIYLMPTYASRREDIYEAWKIIREVSGVMH